MKIVYKFGCSKCGNFWMAYSSIDKCANCGAENDAYGEWDCIPENESERDDDE